MGTGAAETLVQVNEWLILIQTGESFNNDERKLHAELVEQIAEDLITKSRGTERKLLSKSLQEAMYYAVRFDPYLDYDELNNRISRYLHRWGSGTFNKRFLSLFFFNFIRFHAGESFRAISSVSAPLEGYLKEIDHVCQQTVSSVWKSFEKTKRPLDLRAANKLVSDIEQRLFGI